MFTIHSPIDTGGGAGKRLAESGASTRSATTDSGTSPIAMPGKMLAPDSRGSAKEVRLHTDIMTKEVEKVVEKIVTVEVPGPERIVEVIKEVPVEHVVMKEVPVYIDRVVESDRIVTAVKEVPVDRIVVNEVAVPVDRIVTNEVSCLARCAAPRVSPCALVLLRSSQILPSAAILLLLLVVAILRRPVSGQELCELQPLFCRKGLEPRSFPSRVTCDGARCLLQVQKIVKVPVRTVVEVVKEIDSPALLEELAAYHQERDAVRQERHDLEQQRDQVDP